MNSDIALKIVLVLVVIIAIGLKLRGNNTAVQQGMAPPEPVTDPKAQNDLDAYVEAQKKQEENTRENRYSGPSYEGEDVPQDYAGAINWYRKAADQGDSWAQFTLGNLYYRGSGDSPPDYAQAIKWFRMAADQGEEDAQDSLGGMYYEGEGVAQDYAEAAKWFRKAADQGHANAQGVLGSMYKEGKGVPQNAEEAYFWLSLASDGDSAGMRNEVERLLTPSQRAAVLKRLKDKKSSV